MSSQFSLVSLSPTNAPGMPQLSIPGAGATPTVGLSAGADGFATLLNLTLPMSTAQAQAPSAAPVQVASSGELDVASLLTLSLPVTSEPPTEPTPAQAAMPAVPEAPAALPNVVEPDHATPGPVVTAGPSASEQPELIEASLTAPITEQFAVPQTSQQAVQPTPAATGFLRNLLDGLSPLAETLDDGDVPDADLKDDITASVDDLVAQLAVQFNLAPQDVATAPATEGAEQPSSAPAPLPGSPLGQLLDKLNALSDRLEASAPKLAKKLEHIAATLKNASVSPEQLSALGFDEQLQAADPTLAKALDALLAPKDAPAPIAAPKIFAQVVLPMPPVAIESRAAPAESAATTEVGTASKPSPDADTSRLALRHDDAPTEPAPKERSAAQSEPAARPDPQPAPAKIDRTPDTAANAPAAMTAQAQQPAAVAAARPVHAIYQPIVAQPNLPQLAFEVARHFKEGQSRFEIRMDPPELGRIDVRMDVDKAGNVTARMAVERVETLDLMQRDQRTLEKALAQAGLDAGKTSLEFSLKQNPFSGGGGNGNDGRNQPGTYAYGGLQRSTDIAVSEAAPVTFQRGTATAGGINLFV